MRKEYGFKIKIVKSWMVSKKEKDFGYFQVENRITRKGLCMIF